MVRPASGTGFPTQPPSTPSPNWQPSEVFLRYGALFTIGGSILYIVLLELLAPSQRIRAVGAAATCLLGLLARALVHRGYRRAATYVMLVGLWAVITAVSYRMGGLDAPGQLLYPLLIFALAWLISPRAGQWMAVLTAVTTLAFAALEVGGHLPPAPPTSPFLRWAIHVIVFVVVSVQITKMVGAYRGHIDALKRSHTLLQTIVDTVPMRVFWKDRNLRYLGCNPQFARDAGRSVPAEVIGQDDYAMAWAAEAEAYRSDDRAVIDSAQSHLAYEETQTTPDGSQVWLRTSKVPLKSPDGEVIGVLGAYDDITEQRRVQQRLAESEAHARNLAALLRLMCDNVPDMIWAKDLEKRYLFANRAMCDQLLCAVDTDEPVGKTDLFFAQRERAAHPDLAEWHTFGELCQDSDAITIAHGAPAVFEEFGRVRGKHLVLDVLKAPFRDAEGRVIGTVGCARDITGRKAREEEQEALRARLEQGHKLESVGRLAGGVAHDFNNMLGVIIGHAEMALDEAGPGTLSRTCLDAILHAAQRSADLTSQLLAFARRQPAAPTVLDVNPCVEQTLAMLRRLIGEPIRLVWRPSPHLPRVKIDRTQLDQLLANLCVNARDAIDGAGTITISTDVQTLTPESAIGSDCEPGSYVTLSIEDTGRGMDQETLARIFEPFFTTKALGEGTGLGLATVYGIVKQNGGCISVVSERGRGTCFHLRLPAILDGAPARSTSHEPAATRRGREGILLVEDEPALLAVTATVLRDLGYTVFIASTPSEARRVARLHRQELDLLITDVILPETSGRELADTLLAEMPSLRCLFVSGYPADVIGLHGALAPGTALLVKPWSRAAFAAKVRDVLDQA